jgi:hypothetical protein
MLSYAGLTKVFHASNRIDVQFYTRRNSRGRPVIIDLDPASAQSPKADCSLSRAECAILNRFLTSRSAIYLRGSARSAAAPPRDALEPIAAPAVVRVHGALPH